jgi:hypothetical protein
MADGNGFAAADNGFAAADNGFAIAGSCAATAGSCAATAESCAATAESCAATTDSCVATADSCAATADSCAATAYSCAATADSCFRATDFAGESREYLQGYDSHSVAKSSTLAAVSRSSFSSQMTSIATSAGVMPGMRPACPRVAGRISVKRICASFFSPRMVV